MLRLRRERWPGNVRQLRSAMEKLFVLARGEAVTGEDVNLIVEPAPVSPSQDDTVLFAASDYREARRNFEAEYLRRKLRRIWRQRYPHGAGGWARAAEPAREDPQAGHQPRGNCGG